MKVAFLNIFSGINERGAEAFAHDLGNRLLSRNQVVFFQAGEKAREQRVQVIKIKTGVSQPASTIPDGFLASLPKRLFLDAANRCVLAFTRKALPILARGDFDIIIPMNGFWQMLLVQLARPWGKYRILITGHSGPGWDERWNLYLKPDIFVATTLPSYEWVKRICPRTQVALIPYAIDDGPFLTAKPKTLPLKKPIVLCPAALVPYKRVDLAINAVASMKNVSLLVLGQGELEGHLRKLGKRLLPGRFLLMSVPHDLMPGYYQGADVVTLPSSPQENSPMVFLESLAARKIVVTTDTPRNRWMLEGAGIFCDPLNIQQYAEALRRALMLENDPKMRDKIDTAVQKFDIRKVVERYEELMESLIQ